MCSAGVQGNNKAGSFSSDSSFYGANLGTQEMADGPGQHCQHLWGQVSLLCGYFLLIGLIFP